MTETSEHLSVERSALSVQRSAKRVSTFNALHLGDNLIHLHFLRKLAAKYPEIHFTHGAPDEHLAQLYPVWSDLPNLTVKSIAEVGQGAINAWRGAGGWWYQQPNRNDFVAVHLDWFRHLAHVMGLESPIHCARDMLFDYPALRAQRSEDRGQKSERIDFLIVNSAPNSGQWGGYDAAGFSYLANSLLPYGSVITTAPTGLGIPCTQTMFAHAMDVTDIGKLSQRARCIIGTVTGPMWPTLNIWSADTVALRVHLLDTERVDLAPNTVHANSLSLVPEILKDRCLL